MKTTKVSSKSPARTSNHIIAGNGRVLKLYLFIVWLCLFKKIYNVYDFYSLYLLMHYSATFNAGCLQKHNGKILGKLQRSTQIPLQGNGMAAISKITIWQKPSKKVAWQPGSISKKDLCQSKAEIEIFSGFCAK